MMPMQGGYVPPGMGMPQQPKKGSGAVIVVVIIAVLVGVGGLVALVMLGGNKKNTTTPAAPKPPPSSSFAAPHTVNVLDLKVGDCVDGIQMDTVNTDLTVRSCFSPHDAEVIYKFNLPDSSWPGLATAKKETEDRCSSAIDSRVSGSSMASRLSDDYLYPSTLSEFNDDKGVICLVVDKDSQKLTSKVG
jgi:hypothetical protein